MNARDYSQIDTTPDQSALSGFLDGFLGLLDQSQAPDYLLAYAVGGAEFARNSI